MDVISPARRRLWLALGVVAAAGGFMAVTVLVASPVTGPLRWAPWVSLIASFGVAAGFVTLWWRARPGAPRTSSGQR